MKFLVFGAGVFSGGARGRDLLVMVGAGIVAFPARLFWRAEGGVLCDCRGCGALDRARVLMPVFM